MHCLAHNIACIHARVLPAVHLQPAARLPRRQRRLVAAAASAEAAPRRVVVTGQGVVSSLGNSPDEFYNNLLAGKSGIGLIEGWDTCEGVARSACLPAWPALSCCRACIIAQRSATCAELCWLQVRGARQPFIPALSLLAASCPTAADRFVGGLLPPINALLLCCPACLPPACSRVQHKVCGAGEGAGL